MPLGFPNSGNAARVVVRTSGSVLRRLTMPGADSPSRAPQSVAGILPVSRATVYRALAGRPSQPHSVSAYAAPSAPSGSGPRYANCQNSRIVVKTSEEGNFHRHDRDRSVRLGRKRELPTGVFRKRIADSYFVFAATGQAL